MIPLIEGTLKKLSRFAVIFFWASTGVGFKLSPTLKAELLKEKKGVTFVENAYDAVKNAELLIVVTEWNEFKELDLKKVKSLMKAPNLIDGRNIYSPEKAKALGFEYVGVGRK